MSLGIRNLNSSINTAKINFGDKDKSDKPQYLTTMQKPITLSPVVKNNDAKNKMDSNKLQFAMSLLSTAAAVVIAGIFLKSSGVFNRGSKQAKKAIEKLEAPDFVKEKLMKELKKGTEESMNYINHVMSLPWKDPEPKLFDIKKARKILDEEIVGMEDVKKQLLRHLTVQNFKIKNGVGTSEPFVICMDGEPGTGKTSLAEIVAKAMDTYFGRISLGGVSDANHITGFKRTYKDAKPGVLISTMQEAKVKNPVILLDEMDKLGVSKEHGSPAAALLDVLEPKQCRNFTDEHLEIPYDLSKVTFIMTSNNLNGIPKTLQDRIKIIKVGKYTDSIKEKICDKNALNFIKEFKLDSSKVEFTNEGISELVKFSNDSGARNTLRNLKDVFYKFIEDLENGKYGKQKVKIDKQFVQDVLATQNA